MNARYGVMQEKPVVHFDSGVKGRLGLRLAEAGLGGGGTARDGFDHGVNMDGDDSTIQKYKSRSKKARARFNKWFTSEIEKDMTEQQLKSLRRLEGDHSTDSSSHRNSKFARRPMSPRLVSEHVRQLQLRAIPVPYKVLSDAAQRNLQSKMCRPLADLWQSGTRNVPTVKQLAMTASMEAGELTLTPGVDEGPALDPSWMDPSSRAVLRWAPMIHTIVETDKNEADAKKEGIRLSSGRRAEMYQNAPPEMTVTLEPRQSPRNQVKFKEGGMMSKNKARLAVWTHIEGSKASTGLFPQYTLPSGERAFFYEYQGMHEAVFPPELPPLPPTTEDSFGAPVSLKEVCAVAPNWEKDPPLLRCQPAPPAPTCPTQHPGSELDKSSTNTERAAADEREVGINGINGGVATFNTLDAVLENLSSSSHRVISFSVAHSVDVLQQQHTTSVIVSPPNLPQASNGWTLEGSVFAPRPYEVDSASFWDESWVRGAAFNVDWARALRKQSFRNLICSTHGAGRCAFSTDDEVEVQSEDMTYWFPARVVEVTRGPTLNVIYADRSVGRFVALSRARFPNGGEAGGYGGRCRRWASPRTEENTILLSTESLPDIIGLNGSEIRRIRHESGCKITVKQNGSFYSLHAVGVPENLEILNEILSDIEELALVRQALKLNFAVSIATFSLFSSYGNGDQFAIQSNEYDNFLTQCGIVDVHSSTCGRHHLSNIFKAVNVEESHEILDKEDQRLHDSNLRGAIVRYEWLELIVRVAQAKYALEGSGLDECIEMLFHRNIEPFLGTLGEMDHNIFRDSCLYTQETDQVLRQQLSYLIALFTAFAGTHGGNGGSGSSSPRHRAAESHPGSRKREVMMSLSEWLLFLRTHQLITSQFSMVEAKFCFHASKLLVIDDVNQQDRSRMMTFVSFLEALCRMVDIMFIPTIEQMNSSGHANFHTYHLHLQKHGDREEHKQARFRAKVHNSSAHKHYLHRRHVDHRPLPERLSIFLELLAMRKTLRGSLTRRRRIATWYADQKYETTRNSAHDTRKGPGVIGGGGGRMEVFETTATSLLASKAPPKLVFVPTRPIKKRNESSSRNTTAEKGR